MVPLRRLGTDSDQAGASVRLFDGSESNDIRRFLFFFESSALRGVEKQDATVSMFQRLEGQAAEVFYYTLSNKGEVMPEEMKYEEVKAALIEMFGKGECPEERARKAIQAKLNLHELRELLNELNCVYSQARLDITTRFSLLKQAVGNYTLLAKFVMFKQPKRYDELVEVIRTFDTEGSILRQSNPHSVEFRKPQESQGGEAPMRVDRHELVEPGNLEMKNQIEDMADELARLSLLANMKTTKQEEEWSKEALYREITCSYCGVKGHIAGTCPDNPNCSAICSECGRK